jgi:putative ABC transport system substrate-binding protein
LELLHQLVPKASSLAVLLNPLNSNFEPQTKLLLSAAGALGIALNVLRVHTNQDIDMAFGAMLDQHVNGLLIGPDSFIFSRNAQIAALAQLAQLGAGFSDFRDCGVSRIKGLGGAAG